MWPCIPAVVSIFLSGVNISLLLLHFTVFTVFFFSFPQFSLFSFMCMYIFYYYYFIFLSHWLPWLTENGRDEHYHCVYFGMDWLQSLRPLRCGNRVFFCFFFTCVLQLGTLGLVRRLALFHHAVGLWAGGGSHGGGDILVQLPPRPPNITVC